MADAATPTLEDLRNVPEAAWLWDAGRARIVWANPAGIGFFGGASLFDLIDRPFDAQEPGVEAMMNLSRSLHRGQVETVELNFPSTAAEGPIICRCMIHALADGRPGVLAVARSSGVEGGARADADMAAAFDLLPSAALLMGRGGGFRHLNAAAQLLLDANQRGNLAELLGDQAQADALLARIGAAGTVVQHRALAVRIGIRDIRLTARRLNREEEGAAFAMLLLDDVTERRALELKLSGAEPLPPPPAAAASQPAAGPKATAALSEADAAAFEKPGKPLEDEIREAKPRPARAAPPPVAEAAPPPDQPRRKLQRIPDQVRLPLENRPEAVLVAKDGQLLFANPSAARLFGYETGEDVINDQALSNRFGQLGQALPRTEIVTGAGRAVEANVHMVVIPWLGGPARQFVLLPNGTTQAERPELRLAPAPAAAPAMAAAEPAPAAVAKMAPAPEPQRASAEVIQLPPRPPGPDADQELRAILDTAADGIITLDQDARIHTFSAGAEAIFGYRIAEVAGKPLLDLLAPESRKLVRDYLAALQGPGLAAVFNDGREVTALVNQGGTVPLFITIGKLQAARSQAAFCAVVRDITQWKKTEAELREAKEKAEATSRQKSEFLASVSHELRTPLNAIMGFSEVMRLGRFGEIDNEKYRGYVQDIHASGAHLLSLIDDLLDLSKVEAGKLELNFAAVSLGDVADYVLRLTQEQATAARVVLRKSMPPDLPKVVADLRSMRQALLNLVSNAIKFTDAGGQVVVSAQLLGNGELKLRVKDTGIGMDEDQLRGALEPFGRVLTEGREVQGTGLGLPLTKALVEANRASLALTSEPRKGTLAEIAFPTTRVLAE
ncbi:MAG: PAS domain-containing sensor histidine kinase [Aestuariivirga sp.]|uniref:sensor histidine kinase n=1 Tax=Aestuariivirga sp. TaxID=2650926 RepID=UPI0025BFC8D2|nr:PAS domain-containing sensor histidine kinase [Aestuariivirga sp.]MCA3559616.1 PAS domain-containing sensor histidine kinase [Aestuariivirga sp.]